MTVMATTSILFIMATTLMTVVAYQSQATALRVGRVRATHVADAGINAYLYLLRKHYDTYKANLDTGWVTVSGVEKYRVRVVPPTDGKPLTLYSTGVAGDGTQTIAATVRFPTFGDYMFLSGSDLSIAADALINGQVRSNGNIDIGSQGKITGKVIAGGVVTGNGSTDRGYLQHQPTIDFNQVLATMDDIRNAAGASSSFFPASGALGYRVVVTGNSVAIDKVVSGIDTGKFVTEPVTAPAIPSSGVFYFADTVWVQGAYSRSVTIVADGDINLIGDYAPLSQNSTATSGLIAKKNIIVPSWYGNNVMNVNAALLSQSGAIYADIKQGFIRERINITGSLSYAYSGGGFVTGNKYPGQPVAGFRQNVYTYDQRLNLYPPPMYPVIRDGSLKVDTWIENRTPSF